jgi:hypothetical protein
MSTQSRPVAQGFVEEVTEALQSGLGEEVQFRIFDPQICGSFQVDWLAGALEGQGVNRLELDWMLNEGMLRRFKVPSGEEGFILYTERMAVVGKKLWDSRRYTIEELRHVFDDWYVHLEIISTEHLAYDSYEVDDYDHFRRRATEMIEISEHRLSNLTENNPSWTPDEMEHRKLEAEKNVFQWRRIHDLVSNCADAALAPATQKFWRKKLFQLRWLDEWCRIMQVREFETQILQGYSPEVAFSGSRWQNGETTLTHLSWSRTLDCFKETINEGKAFPLRTPDFNVTPSGITFLRNPSPAEYHALFEKVNLDQLFAELERRGPDYWICDLQASGRGKCAECEAIFERTTSSRKYCSDRCSSRAKSRRWQESNPERAREAQAKYYRENYPED